MLTAGTWHQNAILRSCPTAATWQTVGRQAADSRQERTRSVARRQGAGGSQRNQQAHKKPPACSSLRPPRMVCKAWRTAGLYVHMGGGERDNSGRLRWAVVAGVQPIPAGRKKNFCKSRTNTNRHDIINADKTIKHGQRAVLTIQAVAHTRCNTTTSWRFYRASLRE